MATILGSISEHGVFDIGQTVGLSLVISGSDYTLNQAKLHLTNGGTAVFSGVTPGGPPDYVSFSYVVQEGDGLADDLGIESISGVSDSNGPLTYSGSPLNTTQIICFYPGTLVATPEGERPVETLAAGDMVVTHDGQVRPIRWMGRQTAVTRFANPLRVLPIRIAAGALAEGVPKRDLLVSPDHALLVGDVLVQAGALVNGATITRERDVPERFTYWHVELAEHALILAEGAPAETFVDNVDRMGFDNWDSHPDYEAANIEELPLPRAKSARQVPRSVRVLLAARAEALGAKQIKVA